MNTHKYPQALVKKLVVVVISSSKLVLKKISKKQRLQVVYIYILCL